MAMHSGLFETELRKLAQERVDALAASVIDGMMTESQYRWTTGMIAGLRKLDELCDEANTNLAKR